MIGSGDACQRRFRVVRFATRSCESSKTCPCRGSCTLPSVTPLNRSPTRLSALPTTNPPIFAMGSRLHNAPIVLDNGSGTIRAGFAGQDVPKCFFPSFVGRPKHVRTMAGALEGDVFIGPQAQQYRGLFKINYPLEHGIVTDWDDMERIWQYVYTEELKTVSEDVSKNPC